MRIPDLSQAFLLVVAVVLAAVVAVLIVVYLLSRRQPEGEMQGFVDAGTPESQELALLRSIDRKLTAVNLVAILALVGWAVSCVLVVLSTILGTGFVAWLMGLRQLLR